METLSAKNDNWNIQEKLNYCGLVLLEFEVIKSLIIRPIKTFYYHVTFSDDFPFKTYELDVLSRDKNEFMACLLYLKDFMEAIDGNDIVIIQELREKRNQIAHELMSYLFTFNPNEIDTLLEKAKRVLFKISNYRVRMDIGYELQIKNIKVDWDKLVGTEYIIFNKIFDEIKENSRRITIAST